MSFDLQGKCRLLCQRASLTIFNELHNKMRRAKHLPCSIRLGHSKTEITFFILQIGRHSHHSKIPGQILMGYHHQPIQNEIGNAVSSSIHISYLMMHTVRVHLYSKHIAFFIILRHIQPIHIFFIMQTVRSHGVYNSITLFKTKHY